MQCMAMAFAAAALPPSIQCIARGGRPPAPGVLIGAQQSQQWLHVTVVLIDCTFLQPGLRLSISRVARGLHWHLCCSCQLSACAGASVCGWHHVLLL